jgi:hypothetical protein
MLYQSKYMYIFSHSCCNITYLLNFHIASCKCCSSMHTLGHAELEQENTVVHKRQAVRILTLLLNKVSPDASNSILEFYL